jgi:ribosomal protein S18 acetylase RimI-like enzyme
MNRSLQTPRGEIVIREATPTDAIQFRKLRLYALQDSPTAFSADYQKNLNHSTEYWEDLLTMHPDESTIFLAAYDNNLIANTGIVRGGMPKTRHSATIWGVYVRPEWRGLHVAEELIHACFTWARARKIVAARLGVTATNTSAIRCYERCGFIITGTEPRAVYYEGHYHDFYTMYCPLDDLQLSKENL